MTHGYLVDVVLDDADAQRLHPHLRQMAATGLRLLDQLPDALPDAIVFWRRRPDAEALLQRALRDGRVMRDGRLQPFTGTADELAEMLELMPGQVDWLPDGRQLRVKVCGHPHVTVTPRHLAWRPMMQASMQVDKHASRPELWVPVDDGVQGLPWDTMTDADGCVLGEWAYSGLMRSYVLPHPAATPAELQHLLERAGQRDAHHAVMAPTHMLNMVHGAVDGRPKAKDRKLRNKGTAVERFVAGYGKKGGTVVTVELTCGAQMLLEGSTDTLAQSEADVVRTLMDQATKVFTPDVLRTFASLCALMDPSSGVVHADYATLGSVRGWAADTLDAGSAPLKRGVGGGVVPRTNSRRKRLQESLRTLMTYRWRLTGKAGKNTSRHLEGQLVVPAGVEWMEREGIVVGDPSLYVMLNPLLFTPLMAAGWVAAFDKRLLLLEDDALRVGIYLARRMAPSFASHDLGDGKPLKFGVGTLLEGAGLSSWPDRIRKHGPDAAREQVVQTLEQLCDLQDGGPALWYEYHAAETPAADAVTVWHGQHLVEAQLQHSDKRVAAAKRHAASRQADLQA